MLEVLRDVNVGFSRLSLFLLYFTQVEFSFLQTFSCFSISDLLDHYNLGSRLYCTHCTFPVYLGLFCFQFNLFYLTKKEILQNQ